MLMAKGEPAANLPPVHRDAHLTIPLAIENFIRGLPLLSFGTPCLEPCLYLLAAQGTYYISNSLKIPGVCVAVASFGLSVGRATQGKISTMISTAGSCVLSMVLPFRVFLPGQPVEKTEARTQRVAQARPSQASSVIEGPGLPNTRRGWRKR